MLYMLWKTFLEGWMLLKLHINTWYSLGRRLTVIWWRNVGMAVKCTGDFHVHPLSHSLSHSLTFTHTHTLFLPQGLIIHYIRSWHRTSTLGTTVSAGSYLGTLTHTHMHASTPAKTHTHTLWLRPSCVNRSASVWLLNLPPLRLSQAP